MTSGFLVKSLLNKNWHNSRNSNDQLNLIREIQRHIDFDDDVVSTKYQVIVIFPT